jgi:hypothetical protein
MTTAKSLEPAPLHCGSRDGNAYHPLLSATFNAETGDYSYYRHACGKYDGFLQKQLHSYDRGIAQIEQKTAFLIPLCLYSFYLCTNLRNQIS